MRRYGVVWPFISRNDVHTGLLRFYLAYQRFSEEVHQHGFQRDMAFEREPEILW